MHRGRLTLRQLPSQASWVVSAGLDCSVARNVLLRNNRNVSVHAATENNNMYSRVGGPLVRGTSHTRRVYCVTPDAGPELPMVALLCSQQRSLLGLFGSKSKPAHSVYGSCNSPAHHSVLCHAAQQTISSRVTQPSRQFRPVSRSPADNFVPCHTT